MRQVRRLVDHPRDASLLLQASYGIHSERMLLLKASPKQRASPGARQPCPVAKPGHVMQTLLLRLATSTSSGSGQHGRDLRWNPR